MAIEQTSYLSQVFSSSVAKIAKVVIAFSASIVFARILGPTGYGSFYLILAIVEIGDRVVKGWSVAGKKRISEEGSNPREICGSMLILWFGTIPLVLLITYSMRTPLEVYTEVPSSWILISLLFITISLFIIFENLTQGLGRIDAATWATSLQEWGAFPFQLALIILGFSVAGLVYGYAIGVLIALPILFYHSYYSPILPSKETWASLWEYAKYSILDKFLGQIYSRVDILLLGLLVSPAAAGYYEIAYRISLLATIVSSSAALLLMSRVSNLRSKGKEYSDDIITVLSFSSIISIPLFFGSILIADELIVILYGNDYLPAGKLLIGIALYAVIRSQSEPLAEYLNGIDRPDLNLKVSLITLLLNIMMAVPFVMWVGTIGVVISTIISELFRYVSVSYLSWRYFNLDHLLTQEFRLQIIAGIIMFLAIFPVVSYNFQSNIMNAFIPVMVGGFCYLLLLLYLSRTTRHIAKRMIWRLWSKSL